MTLTIGNWIIIGLIIIVGAILTVLGFMDTAVEGLVALIISLVLCVAVIFGCNWYNTKTANGIRNYNTYKSNLKNGIERTIDIYGPDGTLRYHYEGTVDIDDSGEFELFFDTQDGQRVIIHYGIQDLVVIQSKGKGE